MKDLSEDLADLKGRWLEFLCDDNSPVEWCYSAKAMYIPVVPVNIVEREMVS